MKLNAYLERIGFHGPVRPDLETLRRVHRAHQLAVPFENLDVQLERPATLAELCDHADERMGPFGSEPANLMFVVHGHVRRMLRSGKAEIVAAGERPPRYRLS